MLQEGGALYGVLLAGSKVAALSQGGGRPLHPHDLLALAAFVRGSPSFQATETFSPVCLPHFNPAAFLHAYVHYLHKACPSTFSLVLVSHCHPGLMFDYQPTHKCNLNLHGAVLLSRWSVSFVHTRGDVDW